MLTVYVIKCTGNSVANGHRICNAFRYKIRIYEAIVLVGNRVKVCALVLAHAFVNTPAQHITRVIENCVSVPAFAPVFGTYTVLFLVHFTSIWYLYCYKIGMAPSLRGVPSDCVWLYAVVHVYDLIFRHSNRHYTCKQHTEYCKYTYHRCSYNT